MIDVFVGAVLLAADSGPRGDNPDGVSGVLIIVGIVLTVAIGGFVLYEREAASPPAASQAPSGPAGARRAGSAAAARAGSVRALRRSGRSRSAP